MYSPVRRYHPAPAFNSNNHQPDLDTAENIQYAYEGGESSAGVGSFGQGHVGEVDLTISHGGDMTKDHPGGHDLTHGVHELTHHDLTQAESQDSPVLDVSHSQGYEYPVHHDFEDGYHYDHPHGYEYLPPTGHQVLESLPVLTTPPPPPPAEAAKQSPNFTYYYLGRHLWYIPLYFSIYFILYVGALVLKSVARHKILFPENLKVAAQSTALRRLDRGTRKYFM